jgi:hypothetical protein
VLLEATEGSQLMNIIDIRNRLAQRDSSPDVALGAGYMVDILPQMAHQVCTSPHDFIYSVLGLIYCASLPGYLAPNYSLPYQKSI